MAYSSSVKHAQAIKLCELCYEEKIKWRCTDCEMCLWEKCKSFHLRVPVTAKHQIVTIATPIQDVQMRIVTDNIPCKDHVTKMNCLFCQTCDCLVCPECVSTSHTKHQFIPMEKARDHKLEQLKGIQAEVTGNLKLCDSKTTEVEKFTSEYNFVLVDSIAKIKQKEQELKDTISQCSKVLQEEVEVEGLKVKTVITKVEQDIDDARKKLDEVNKEIETVLVSNQGQIIFETSLVVPVLTFDPLPKIVQNFIPENTTTKQIQELFGSIQEETMPFIKAEFRFEVLKTFTIDMPAILQVIPLDDTQAWITYEDSSYSVMRKVTFQENKIVTINEISLAVLGMTLISEYDILLVKFKDSEVKLMTQTGKIKPFLTVAPWFPTAIHVTKDKKVIICVKELGNPFTPTESSQRAVMVFCMDGKHINTFQYDKDGKRLFTYPKNITSSNQDILIIDKTSRTTGRVVTLDKEGNLRRIYEGHPIINGSTEFHPVCIVTSSTGYTIVSDFSSHALHVLSENGEVVTCKVMRDMGIMYPLGLNVDKRGKLWMGCSSSSASVLGAKLHIIKML